MADVPNDCRDIKKENDQNNRGQAFPEGIFFVHKIGEENGQNRQKEKNDHSVKLNADPDNNPEHNRPNPARIFFLFDYFKKGVNKRQKKKGDKVAIPGKPGEFDTIERNGIDCHNGQRNIFTEKFS